MPTTTDGYYIGVKKVPSVTQIISVGLGGHFMRDASHFEVEFDQWVVDEIDAVLAQEDTNDAVQ